MLELLIPFFIAIILLTVTPGLDTALIIRTATVENKRKAFHAGLGIASGCLVWGILIALGVGVILSASELGFNLMKWVGAIYLVWLGLGLLFKPRKSFEIKTTKMRNENWFLKGFLTNILNPKVGIFYISFLPQFVPSTGNSTLWLLSLVSVHVSLGILWSVILITSMQSISKFLHQNGALKKIDQITGSIFILFAVKLAFTNR